ncbi:MAG: metal ABC transporter solute-binding protein, Zn/Mn family [Phormidesmis sp.]
MRFSLRLFTLLATGGTLALFPHMLAARSQGNAKVVVSHSVLCDLTQQIAQDTVDVTCLIESGEDPHVYNATPSDRRVIEDAELLLYSGYNFEPDIIQMLEATDSTVPRIAVAEAAVTDPLIGAHHHHDHAGHSDEEHGDEEHGDEEHGDEEHGDEEHGEHGEHSDHEEDEHEEHGHHEEDEHGDHSDHEEGEHDEKDGHDDHSDHEEEGEADPHVWHDAENGIEMVQVIQRQLSETFPNNASLYQANAETLVAQLTQLDTWIHQQIKTVPESQRVLVSTHDALGYYAEAYNIRIEAALASFSTEARPSAADLRELIDAVEDSNVPTVFVESTSNPRLIEAVSRETDIQVSAEPLYADSLGEAGTPAATYQGMLTANTCTIVEGLGGNCDEAGAQTLLK